VGTVALIGALVCGLYAVIGVHTAGRQGHLQLETAFDRAIPMQPAWVLVYLLIYFQGIAPITVARDQRALQRGVAAYLTIYSAAVPIWLLWPVTVPREPLPIVDLWTFGVGLTRYIDPPTNCLPSMHVALSVAAALVVRRLDPFAGRVLLLTAALVTWSTFAIEQHWIADAVVAVVLALFADWLWFSRKPLPPDALLPLPRRWHAVWVGAYVTVALVLMSGWWFGWVPIDQLPPNTERW
jgi:membrane-associated phospholipid phosphatase